MGPFVFTVGSSLKTVAEIHAFPPTLFPAVPQWQNYVSIFTIPGVPYAIFYRNTIIIAVLVLAVLGSSILNVIIVIGIVFTPIVALMPSHNMNRASPGASRPLRASCSSTSEAARIRPSTLSGSSRGAVPSCPWSRPRP